MHEDNGAGGCITITGHDARSRDTADGWFERSVLTVLGWIGSIPDSAVGNALVLVCDLQAAVETRGEHHDAAA